MERDSPSTDTPKAHVLSPKRENFSGDVRVLDLKGDTLSSSDVRVCAVEKAGLSMDSPPPEAKRALLEQEHQARDASINSPKTDTPETYLASPKREIVTADVLALDSKGDKRSSSDVRDCAVEKAGLSMDTPSPEAERARLEQEHQAREVQTARIAKLEERLRNLKRRHEQFCIRVEKIEENEKMIKQLVAEEREDRLRLRSCKSVTRKENVHMFGETRILSLKRKHIDSKQCRSIVLQKVSYDSVEESTPSYDHPRA